MQKSRLMEMQRYVGFDERDVARLRELRPAAKPFLSAVVARFCEELQKHASAREVLTEGETQIVRLRKVVERWMSEVFDGDYDEAYYAKRAAIGEVHVAVKLPQHYMLLGMELIWQELEVLLRSAGIADVDEKLRSLHKALTLELVIMLESYKESYSQQIRRTERSAVEEKLTRAAHLAEIGQLAASLAHEIKNPLAGISGAIQIIREDMEEDDPRQSIISEILGQIGRLDDTVKDLLQYARPTPPHAEEVALDEAVSRVLTVLREEPAFQRVRIEYAGGPDDSFVYADEAQIEQLVMNLLINAAHASDDGGVVYLKIACDTSYVRLIVNDKGKGMTPEVRDRAFEPFFTTKAKGTGLGLSICRRIAEVHGGRIEIQSEPGVGTTLTVDLPRSADWQKRRANP